MDESILERAALLAQCHDGKRLFPLTIRFVVEITGALSGALFIGSAQGMERVSSLTRPGGTAVGPAGAITAARRAAEARGPVAIGTEGGSHLLALPLMRGDRAIGACCLELDGPAPDRRLIELFLSHAALIIENSILQRDLAERRRSEKRSALTPAQERHVQEAEERLASLPAGSAVRNDLARALGLSPDYLGKLFKNKTGRSLRSYRNELMVKKALDLMGNGSLTIDEVAAEAGFASRRTFYRFFRRLVGMTPAEYRRMLERAV